MSSDIATKSEVEAASSADIQKDSLLSFLESRSGINKQHIQSVFNRIGLTDMVSLPTADVISKLFSGEEYTDIRDVLLQPNLTSKRPSSLESNNYVWLDILTAWVQLGSGKKYVHELFPIIADNGLMAVKQRLPQWSRAVRSMETVFKDRNKQTDLAVDEDLKDRFSYIDNVLEKIHLIGLEEINKGRIPITRLITFDKNGNTASLRQLAAETERSGEVFTIYNEPKISTLHLMDVERHKAGSQKNSPLVSWSFAPLDEHPALHHFSDRSAILLVSSLPSSKFGWSRVLDQAIRDDVLPLWKWYLHPNIDEKPISDQTSIASLIQKGYKGMLIASEDETVIWDTIPNLGVFELSF